MEQGCVRAGSQPFDRDRFFMTAYKAPTFADRQAAATAAREKALAKLKAKAPLDPAVVAERKAAAERKAVAAEEKRLAKIAEREAA